jgi:RNA polymerase sigma-70 factor (ECF subfamily)
MSPEQQEFEKLYGRIRDGSEDAARQLLERCGPHLLAVIRQKLSVHLRSVFDSLDFLQDVWASFFAGELEHSFRDPNALITFLVRMARNKVADEVRRRLGGGKADLSREHSLDGSARFEAAGLTDGLPPPGEQAAASEQWDRLVEGRPFHHVRILEMLRQGYKHTEIAAELGLNEKTVRRLIHKIAASRCRP